ncbi:unnamed protein product, partial [Mesorhabditis spiculigera]
MPKKFVGENSKAAVARERKAEVKKNENEKKQKAAEDALWADDDKQVLKKQQRKEEDEKKRLEQLKRKEENRQAYEEDMANATVKPNVAVKKSEKVTRAQLAARAEAMLRAAEEEKRAKDMEARRLAEIDHLQENVNRLELDESVARNVEEAIAVLGDNEPDPEKHPEKRLRAAYQKYEEVRLPELKKENPTYRMTQLKQVLWKEWKKSPQNPLNA